MHLHILLSESSVCVLMLRMDPQSAHLIVLTARGVVLGITKVAMEHASRAQLTLTSKMP